MRWLMTIALLLLAQSACAQMRYVVSSSSQAYTSFTPTHSLSLSDNQISNVIDPGQHYLSMLSFPYFGWTYSGFQVCSNGFLILTHHQASPSSFNAAYVDHAVGGGRIVAPYWADLVPGAGSSIGWEMQGDVLVVQWANMTIPGGGTITMAAYLDSSTQRIEFHYGAATGTAAASAANTVAISSSAYTPPQWITNGEDVGFVNADGSVAQWPANRLIAFDVPPGGAPTFTVTMNGNAVTHQSPVYLGTGTHVISTLAIVITVNDPDGQPVNLATTLIAGTGLVQSEWENTAGAVPFTLTPSSGSFTTSEVFIASMQAEDGDWYTEFSLVLDARGGGGGGGAGGTGSGGKFPSVQCAATSLAGDCGPVLGLMAIIAGLAVYRRRARHL